jgi:hypothetical protein
MAEWTAEITNDPDRHQELYIELLQGGEYRGRIVRAPTGELALFIYERNEGLTIPLDWLLEVMNGARRDLVR